MTPDDNETFRRICRHLDHIKIMLAITTVLNLASLWKLFFAGG
jgi:hypothetical protein